MTKVPAVTAADEVEVEDSDEPQEPDELPWRPSNPRSRTVLRAIGVIVVVAALAVCGVINYQHNKVAGERRTAAGLEAVARQGVVSLMSLSPGTAKADVQRILDNATGSFKSDFAQRADDFVQVVEQSHIATTGRVTATALQSVSDDSAVVLVSAISDLSEDAGDDQPPQAWRLVVTLDRGGDQVKISKVEFLQ